MINDHSWFPWWSLIRVIKIILCKYLLWQNVSGAGAGTLSLHEYKYPADKVSFQTDLACFCVWPVSDFYRTQVSLVLCMGLVLTHSLTHWPCWNLTDVTPADEDTKSILINNANREIKGNQAMHVIKSGVQMC